MNAFLPCAVSAVKVALVAGVVLLAVGCGAGHPAVTPTQQATPPLSLSARVSVAPDTARVGATVKVRGTGFRPGEGYFVVLAPFDNTTPRPDRPPEGFPVPIPGGFPEVRLARANGCQLATALAGDDGTFAIQVTIPDHCVTLNGDPANVLPGTYMIWDTSNVYPPRSIWFTVTR